MEVNRTILHEVEVFLYKSHIVGGGYTAKVGSERTLSLRDVAESATLRGRADLTASTLEHATETIFKEAAYLLCDGFSVNFGYFQISLKIRGIFDSPDDMYDPERHSLLFQITPGELLSCNLPSINLKMRGLKKNLADIVLVTDTYTGLIDGTITPNEDIMIQGTRIRVMSNDESDSETGIFFVSDNGTAVPVSRRLTQNNSSCVIARVPDLPAGEYLLRIVTRYTPSRKEPLKHAITAEYYRKLTV